MQAEGHSQSQVPVRLGSGNAQPALHEFHGLPPGDLAATHGAGFAAARADLAFTSPGATAIGRNAATGVELDGTHSQERSSPHESAPSFRSCRDSAVPIAQNREELVP